MGAEPSAELTIFKVPPYLSSADGVGFSAEGAVEDGLAELGAVLGDDPEVEFEPQANRDTDNNSANTRANAFLMSYPPK